MYCMQHLLRMGWGGVNELLWELQEPGSFCLGAGSFCLGAVSSCGLGLPPWYLP